MLSTKFKVSFVKLSLEIRYSLKDILHNAVTSNLIITTYQKSFMCLKGKKKCYASFREKEIKHSYFAITFSIFQLASNSIKPCEAHLDSVVMWRGLQVLYQVKTHDKMLFEVDYSWGSVWLSLPTSLNAFSPPFAPDYTREKKGAVLNKCHRSLQELHWSLLLCKFRMSWCLC